MRSSVEEVESVTCDDASGTIAEDEGDGDKNVDDGFE